MDIVLSSDDDDVLHPEYIEDNKTENKLVNKSAKKAAVEKSVRMCKREKDGVHV